MMREILRCAEKKNVILVHDLASCPTFPSISKSLSDLQPIWNTVAVPLTSEYSAECWKKIVRKLMKFEGMKEVVNCQSC